jgi:hypothetical protein
VFHAPTLTQSTDDSLFREKDSLFRQKDSLFRCVGNWAASHWISLSIGRENRREQPESAKYAVNFPDSGNWGVETGSMRAASTTTQSYATGDFLKVYERPRIGGDPCDGSFSETASLQSAGRFCAFFSGPEIPFPGNGDRKRQRLGSNAG